MYIHVLVIIAQALWINTYILIPIHINAYRHAHQTGGTPGAIRAPVNSCSYINCLYICLYAHIHTYMHTGMHAMSDGAGSNSLLYDIHYTHTQIDT